MKRIFVILCTAFALQGQAQNANIPDETGKFEANWNSLSGWECPEWFKDAKFGLWAHWGPQCQAEDGDWYARFMYYSGTGQYNWNCSHFGNPSVYGLKELCRDWKAANWDPEKIIEKYKAVGCKYFMTLGNHHDNFDLWNSTYQPWNSVNMGPEKDIVKGWAEACKKNNLRMGVSIHASHAWTWLEPSQQFDGNLTKEEGTGKWWEGYDPQDLYAQRHAHSTGWDNSGTIHSQWAWGNGASLPDEAYKTKLQNRVRQLINDYQPDMLYFDDTVLPFWGCDEQWGLDFLRYYYNHMSNLNGGGDPNVVVTGKILPEEQMKSMLWDVERGIPDRPQKEYWQTCTCIGSWHYDVNNTNYKSAETVIRMLVDICSKNGNLLLSIPLRADGTYDSKEEVTLNGIEAWMKINGESIYGTRVWTNFGEGPLAEAANPMTAQGFNEGQNYSSQDVRFVERNDTVYATIMCWPSAGDFIMTSFGTASPYYQGQIDKVCLLGYGEVPFTQNLKGLTIQVPSTHPNEIAPAFRITFKASSQSDYEILQGLITDIDAMREDLLATSSDVNTGRYNTAKVNAVLEAVSQAKTVSKDEEAAVGTALSAVRTAYQDLQQNGVNNGGLFSGSIAANKTNAVLVEGDNFSGALSGTRYGTLDNWTSENYSINKGTEGVRKGLDNYSGTRGISLGVWDDKSKNVGDLTNARIYRKVTLEPGVYYFGAAYNSLYGCNNQAYMFVSKDILTTAEVPSKSMAYYQVNTASEGTDLYGLTVRIKETDDYYIGWQDNLDNGGNEQEFRAIKVVFYRLSEDDGRTAAQKLTDVGWQQLNALPDVMDYSQHFFAFTDHTRDLPVVARSAAGDKNWSGTYAMTYGKGVDANTDQSAVWTMDAYNASGLVATGNEASQFIFTSLADQNRQFRTEGWSKTVWQTYSDYGKNGYANDGNREIAYLLPTYSEANGWLLKNKTSDAYLGPWTNGAYENGMEFACNKSAEDATYFDIYTMPRTQWMQQYETLTGASELSPLNISYLITNPSLERYDENRKPIGWTVTGGGEIECGYLSGCNGQLYMNNWQASGQLSDRSLSQVIKSLPAGKYKLMVYSMCTFNGAYLFANDAEASMYSASNSDTSLSFDLAEGSDLTIGVRLKGYKGNNLKYDHFRLYYMGENPIAPTDVKAVNVNGNAKARIYDLNGRQLQKPQKGIYISNNRKCLSK